MASRQLFRRMSLLMRTAPCRLSVMRSPVHLSRQAVISQNLSCHLSAVRYTSSAPPPNIVTIQDEEDFKKTVLESKKPVVVDFYATWCGPCKVLGPRLETIIAKQEGKVIMAKVDIDENMDLAMRYNVQSVPTVFGMKDGQVRERFIGLKEDDEIREFIEKL